MIRRNIHKWHRITSLIVMMPVILWTISGFLHPVMNSFKPAVRNQALPVTEIDVAKVRIPLQSALLQNGISKLRNFRIVKLNEDYYYQVQHLSGDTHSYINCQTGHLLVDGDKVYAAFLAERFLSEPLTPHHNTPKVYHHATAGAFEVVSSLSKPSHYPQSRVINIKLITKFDKEYKASNKLLPVYKVEFDREDHIRLYVETVADRLALAMDDRKATFNSFFAITHSWSFLNNLGKIKSLLIGAFSALCFITSVFGFYVYYISNRKKIKSNSFTHKNRKWHRALGTVFLATTLLYSFSGAWHAWNKLPQKPTIATLATPSVFNATELNLSLMSIDQTLKKEERLTNISVIKINEKPYWQITLQNGKHKSKKYISMQNNQEVDKTDGAYAVYLANQYKGKIPGNVTSTKEVNMFTHSYSMMNKRLPVVQVSYDNGAYYFVETSTGKLAAVVQPADRLERFSFSNLHMHHYWEIWLGKGNGKTIRNAVLMFSTLGLSVIAVTGIFIYLRKKYRH